MVADSDGSGWIKPSDHYAGRSTPGVPRFAQALAAAPILRVNGLVATPAELTPADLQSLERLRYLDVRNGGTMPDLPWTGSRLLDVVALAGLLPTARYLSVCGGPWRLVVPGDRYNYSVKWVGRVVATDALGDDSVARISAARRRAGSGHGEFDGG